MVKESGVWESGALCTGARSQSELATVLATGQYRKN
jgi:hypothetical protein